MVCEEEDAGAVDEDESRKSSKLSLCAGGEGAFGTDDFLVELFAAAVTGIGVLEAGDGLGVSISVHSNKSLLLDTCG